MKKYLNGVLNNIPEILLSLIGVVSILIMAWVLSLAAARAEPQPSPVPVVPVCLEQPEPQVEPIPEQTPGYIYNPNIPLPEELQTVLYTACEDAGVPVALALGIIQVESCFDVDAVSPEGCYGLMQLNPKYFPADLSLADNLRVGIGWLGRLIEQYDDTAAALTAYNAGYDTGSRYYADAVLAAEEDWSSR